MANFETAIARENEILKAVDFTFGYDSSFKNVATGLKSILSNAQESYVIGGVVSPYGSGGLNVSIEPVFAFCNSSGLCVACTETTEPVSFEEADSSLDRIDIIEVEPKEIGFDQQTRKFNDPSTGIKTSQAVDTKKRIVLNVIVKKGSVGLATAPLVDSGFIKLAEVVIPAGTNNITQDMIKNITARSANVNNIDWTSNIQSTFNPGYLADIFYRYLVSHEEDGTHKERTIKTSHIDFGTSSTQVNSGNIPLGQSLKVKNEDFSSLSSVQVLISALAENVNNLYEYSNNILSRYSFIDVFPVACATENIDIATGGEMMIDGINCTVGQLVFLIGQEDSKQNGFYEVQTGAWNRYTGFTNGTSPFNHKFICIKNGNENAGKIFYLKNDSYVIGTDELNFIECIFSTKSKANTVLVRDENGRAEIEEPVTDKNITNKKYVEDVRYSLIPIGYVYTQLPNQLSPWELWSFTIQENWQDISSTYADSFFRVEGNKAQAFENQIEAQKEQVPNVRGSLTGIDGQMNYAYTYGFKPKKDGAFNVVQNTSTQNGYGSTYSAAGGSVAQFDLRSGQTNANGTTYKSNSSYVDGGEVRPKNWTVKIWKRIA